MSGVETRLGRDHLQGRGRSEQVLSVGEGREDKDENKPKRMGRAKQTRAGKAKKASTPAAGHRGHHRECASAAATQRHGQRYDEQGICECSQILARGRLP